MVILELSCLDDGSREDTRAIMKVFNRLSTGKNNTFVAEDIGFRLSMSRNRQCEKRRAENM